jgi:hypothetical protein
MSETTFRQLTLILLTGPLLPAGIHSLDQGCHLTHSNTSILSKSHSFKIKNIFTFDQFQKDIPDNFLKPDIASLPAGLFSTPTKLPWHHACIYPCCSRPVQCLGGFTDTSHTLQCFQLSIICLQFHRNFMIFKRAG